MQHTARGFGGMVTAPHHLAAQAGRDVLADGGNALEAALAAAAVIAVAYPHMNGLGGDAFWLYAAPGEPPRGIDGCGPAGAGATIARYREAGCDAVPVRGPLAANTVAGAVAAWDLAHRAARQWGGRLALERLLEPAIHYARDGVAVTRSLHRDVAAAADELAALPGFADALLEDGAAPAVGVRFRQPALAETLERIAAAGPDGFYRGALAQAVAADLDRAGAPLVAADLAGYRAQPAEPLSLELADAHLFNMPPPTQGLASLMILGLFDRLPRPEAESFAHVHGLVEATKLAFQVRDREIADPTAMTADPTALLAPEALDALAADIDPMRARPWPAPPDGGDTVWFGAVDGAGRAVSVIQSLYWELGSGIVLPETGIVWQNRGASFVLDPAARRALGPGRRPFHTLNPALARFRDGRTMVYGTMGGDGQPQTQAAIFTRYARFGRPLQASVSAPRWLLGRTWGAAATDLKVEASLDPAVVVRLRKAGHTVTVVPDLDPLMGHAGALVHHRDTGLVEGAWDPRSDGAVAAL